MIICGAMCEFSLTRVKGRFWFTGSHVRPSFPQALFLSSCLLVSTSSSSCTQSCLLLESHSLHTNTLAMSSSNNCRFYEKEFPDVDEVVMVVVKSIQGCVAWLCMAVCVFLLLLPSLLCLPVSVCKFLCL